MKEIQSVEPSNRVSLGDDYKLDERTSNLSNSQTLMGTMKRSSTSTILNRDQPSTSKRCRRNSFSSTECQQNVDAINHIQPDDGNLKTSENERTQHNQQRLLRTTKMLKESGLYDVAVRTAALIRQNQQSQKELEELKEETKLFMEDVMNNPENLKIKQILNKSHEDHSSIDSLL